MHLPRLASTLAFVACAALPLFQSAHAADAPGGPVADACKQDVQTLCPGVQPGEGRIAACLKGKRSKLSDGCKAAIKAQRKAKAAE
jgi:hypothetical protein